MKCITKNFSEKDLNEYSKELKISKTMASVLLSKNISLEEAKILYDNPSDLFSYDAICGIELAADVIIKHKKDKIYVFGDYDVDGLTSGYILTEFLKTLNCDVEVYYPERTEGYGLNINWCKKIIENNKNKKPITVITIDNGITANEEIKFLKNNNVTVVIVDHHEPAGTLPEADAICDAWIDRGYGTHLCCAGVAWKLALEIGRSVILNNELLEDKETELDNLEDTLLSLVPYVAVGTIADVMPACTENRAFINLGLLLINNDYGGIFSILKKQENIEKIRTKDIAWTIAPELNACGRLNNIKLAKDLLFSSAAENKKVLDLIKEMQALNKTRKSITEKAIQNIEENNDFSKQSICVADASNYAVGILGILAGKIAEKENKPAIIYQKDDEIIASASCRTACGINLLSIINRAAAKNLAVGAAGHEEACAAKLYVNKIDELRKFFSDNITIETIELPPEEIKILTDVIIKADDITYKIKDEINSFGYTCSEIPTIGIRNQKVKPILWETGAGKKHLLLEMNTSDFKKKYAIYWNGYEHYEELGKPEYVTMTGSLDNGAFCRYCRQVRLDENSTVFTVDKLFSA